MKFAILFTVYFLHAYMPFAQQHPSIILTKKAIPSVKAGLTKFPLLKHSFERIEKEANSAIKSPINVPIPRDGGGGITHEQHKKNYQQAFACGLTFQLTGNTRYAEFVQNLLLKYAEDYNKWPFHPKSRNAQEPGKIFWQNLNDCVWQVYMIQAYDLVFDFIQPENRVKIERDLFSSIIKFLTVDAKTTFDRIHNHATWSCAAVGMTGYVLKNKNWVELALKGSAGDGTTGFLRQLDELFSPDGYYTEGPYYQRYALLPFLLLAKTIKEYEPQQKIYERRNGLIKKAINTTLQLAYTTGGFFPFNDAMKDKTIESEEIIYGVDLAYAEMESSPELLDVAKRQGRIVVSDAGLKVATDLAAGKAKPFQYNSQWIRDGAKGDEGGVGILRSGSNADQQCIVIKASAQGMGHGHFDRLNLLYYDNGVEVFSDYGSARFLNIETKGGGGYLPENNSYAKQTIGHNTVVVDQTSHFNGKLNVAEKFHPELVHFQANKGFQVISVKELNAYEGVQLFRTTILLDADGLKKSLLLDIFQIKSDKIHQYDLPFWYQGHLTEIPFKINTAGSQLKAMGKNSGYEHVWQNGESDYFSGSNSSITFLNNKRFYTTTFTTDTNTRVRFASTGANDPDFNLRTEKAFMISRQNASNHIFCSITEAHGETDPTAETTTGFRTSVSNLSVLKEYPDKLQVKFWVGKKSYSILMNYTEKNNFIQLIEK